MGAHDREEVDTEMKEVSALQENEDNMIEETSTHLPHPLGVQPLGNMYFIENGFELHSKCREGLGTLNQITDTLILDIFSCLEPEELIQISLISKAFYVLTNEEELWKNFVLTKFNGNFQFNRTWRKTYEFQVLKTRGKFNNDEEIRKYIDDNFVKKHIEGFFSDELFQPWRCATEDLYQWSKIDNIDRRSNLSLEEFIEQYEKPNKPVIITDIVTKWSAYNNKEWSRENLIRKYGDISYKMGNVSMTLKDYFLYCSTVREETPLYLFDNEYPVKSPQMLEEYNVPIYFQTDFFSYIERSNKEMRPSYRWTLFGPTRSGSTFHKDPNYTSAWNGLISGKKKWILFPPDIVPPGVIPSKDEADVTTPISVVEWFLNFYSEVKESPVQPIECNLNAGELLFIPHRWWHTALNLEESIAVTQNYVNERNVLNVIEFLKKNSKWDILEELEKGINDSHPNLLDNLRENEKKSKSSWAQLTTVSDNNFKFSFNFED